MKHYYPRQIAGTSLPTPTGWIPWLARANVYVRSLLRVITRLNPAARAGIESRSTAPKIPLDVNEPTAPDIVQAENLISESCPVAVGVEPKTFQTAATDNDKGWRLYLIGRGDLRAQEIIGGVLFIIMSNNFHLTEVSFI